MKTILKRIITDFHQASLPSFRRRELDVPLNNDLIFDAYREIYPGQDLAQVYLFFDEIQELSGWEKFVRRVVDTI